MRPRLKGAVTGFRADRRTVDQIPLAPMTDPCWRMVGAAHRAGCPKAAEICRQRDIVFTAVEQTNLKQQPSETSDSSRYCSQTGFMQAKSNQQAHAANCLNRRIVCDGQRPTHDKIIIPLMPAREGRYAVVRS